MGRRKESNSICGAGHSNNRTRDHSRGAVFPFGQAKCMKAPKQEVVMEEQEGGGANQPLTPTQISIDPANLSTIKAERT